MAVLGSSGGGRRMITWGSIEVWPGNVVCIDGDKRDVSVSLRSIGPHLYTSSL